MAKKRNLAYSLLSAFMAVAATITIGATSAHAQPGAGQPGHCDRFSIGFAIADGGTAINWYLDHRCYLPDGGDIKEVVVVTTEDGIRRDRHVIPIEATHDGRTVRRVNLAPKPLCTSSTVVVEASYRYLSFGDTVSSKRVVYYDPNDNCGA